MSSMENRNHNLDKLFGIALDESDQTGEPTKEVEVIPAETTKLPEVINPDAPDTDFTKETEKLEHIYEVSKGVLDNFSEIATSYGRSKDVEAMSHLVTAMTTAIGQSILIKEKKALIGNIGGGGNKNQINVQQNIFTGDSRELFNLVKNVTQKVIDAKQDDDDEHKE